MSSGSQAFSARLRRPAGREPLVQRSASHVARTQHCGSGRSGLRGGVRRASSFCGSKWPGAVEPLSFKGARARVCPAAVTVMTDASLRPTRRLMRSTLWIRLWGRLLYNPEASRHWRRFLNKSTARRLRIEAALSHASRILPLFTTLTRPRRRTTTTGLKSTPTCPLSMRHVGILTRHAQSQTIRMSVPRLAIVRPMDDYAEALIQSEPLRSTPRRGRPMAEELAETATMRLTRPRAGLPDTTRRPSTAGGGRGDPKRAGAVLCRKLRRVCSTPSTAGRPTVALDEALAPTAWRGRPGHGRQHGHRMSMSAISRSG